MGVEFKTYRGTERASLSIATEGCLLFAAALETIIIAGLALKITDAGRGSVTIALFLRLNDLLVQPLGLLPPLAGAIGRQIAAAVIYGVIAVAVAATIAWVDRRQALGL